MPEMILGTRDERVEQLALIWSETGREVSALSDEPWLDPRYALSIGNQIDLTAGDLLSCLADDDGIDVGQPIRLFVTITKTGDRMVVDWTGTSPQVRGALKSLPGIVTVEDLAEV